VSTPYVDTAAILNTILPVVTSFISIFIVFYLFKTMIGMLKEVK